MINLIKTNRWVISLTRLIIITVVVFWGTVSSGVSQSDETVITVPDNNIDNTDYNSNAAVGDFYDSLLPYGQWVLMPDNNWAWEPYNMPVDWQPYTNGYWSLTDYGWTWVTNDPWGWACYHYGRWDYDNNYGWTWYPGQDWAPAWVVWRTNDDWIGWAPCPRRLHWRDRRGFDLGNIDFDNLIPSHHYCFVPSNHFLDRDLNHRIMPPTWNVRVFNKTKSNIDYRIDNRRIINQLPIQSRLENILGHPVPKMNIIESNRPIFSARGTAATNGQGIQMFKPDFRSISPAEAQKQFHIMTQPDTPFQTNEMTSQQRSNLRSLQQQHQAEQKALEQKHQIEQKALQQQHLQEIVHPPADVQKEQLLQQHQAEQQALQEQMQREQRLLQNNQQREQMMRTAPAAPPARRFEIQPSRSVELYNRPNQYNNERNAPPARQSGMQSRTGNPRDQKNN